MPGKKVVITAGGTGGHLYPAQALAQQLIKHAPSKGILFIAGGLKTNPYFDRYNFSFHEIACSTLLSKNFFKVLKGIKNLVVGFRQSVSILKRYQPDVVVGFGSFYTVSVLLAAKWLKIPIVLHEANSIPGKANQWLAPLASTIALHFPQTAAFFKGKTVEVGLPLREGYSLGSVKKEEALAYYHLLPQKRTLLVFGGSQGAKSINKIMSKCIPVLHQLSLQIIHITGDAKMVDELQALYASHHIPACVKPFETHMQLAWSASDAFLGRSGAATIAEAIEFEVPGVLIPFSFATDNHQEKNADFLVEIIKGSWKLLESELEPEKLSKVLLSFFQDQQILQFKKALKAYKQRPHQITLGQLIINMNPS